MTAQQHCPLSHHHPLSLICQSHWALGTAEPATHLSTNYSDELALLCIPTSEKVPKASPLLSQTPNSALTPPVTHTWTYQTQVLQLDLSQMNHRIQHVGQLMCWSTIKHSVGNLPISIFSPENPKSTTTYLLVFELKNLSHKTPAQSPSTQKLQRDNWSPKSTEKLLSSSPEGFRLASERQGDQQSPTSLLKVQIWPHEQISGWKQAPWPNFLKGFPFASVTLTPITFPFTVCILQIACRPDIHF